MNPSAFSLNKPPLTVVHHLSKFPPSLSQTFGRCFRPATTTTTTQQQLIRIKSENTNESITTNDVVLDTDRTPETTVGGIRFRRVSKKKKAREQREKEEEEEEAAAVKKKKKKKDWESMNLREKAIEVYVGEKGLLFWVNKFAYASIFIIIGGWILFRFVGPSLNLYQLDQPPLSPSAVFKG